MNSPYDVNESEEIVDASSALDIKIDDVEILRIIRDKIAGGLTVQAELNLVKRRKKNNDFWQGEQIKYEKRKLHIHEQDYVDNLVWQSVETRIAIASSRLPDISVTPPDDNPENVEVATNIGKALNLKINNDTMKPLIKAVLRNLETDFIGVVKPFWNPLIGEDGDIEYRVVLPENVIFSKTSTVPLLGFSIDNTDFIHEWIEEPLEVVLNKFPKKEKELLECMPKDSTGRRPSTIRYGESHFTYFKDGRTYEGVAWSYQNLILDKMNCPYYDWTGYERASENPAMGEDGEPMNDVAGEPLMETEKVYRNFFDRPRKPYILVSYLNKGKYVYDATTAIEQAIPLQILVNKRGRQIDGLADRSAGKLVFGNGITKEDVSMVTNDPRQHIRLDIDDARQGVVSIPGNPPSPILFQDLMSNRNQIDSKFATHAQTRGETVAGESGIAKQITREGDLAISDDIATTTTQRVVQEMASWHIQLMKVLYDTQHFVTNEGSEGEVTQIALQQDSIIDGIVVKVKASSTDKATRRDNALQMASSGLADPFSFFEDMDIAKPKERTKRLLYYLTGQADGYASYAKALGIDFQPPPPPMPPGMEGVPGEEAPEGEVPQGEVPGEEAVDPYEGEVPDEMPEQQAPMDLEQILSGQPVEPEGIPSEGYISFFEQFLASGEFDTLDPEQQAMVQEFIQQLKALLEQIA